MAGLFILLGVAVMIILMAQKSKKDGSMLQSFYQKHQLVPSTEIPDEISKTLHAEKLSARKGNLQPAGQPEVPIFWYEWSLQSTLMVQNSRANVNDHYLATVFPMEIVSDDFIQKVDTCMHEKGNGFLQNFRDFFVLNTQRPIAAKRLKDGTFIIWWRAKNLAKDYERTFSWLQNNFSVIGKEGKIEIKEPVKISEPVKPKTEIPRLSINEFLNEMQPADRVKSLDMIRITDYAVWDYHDMKSHSYLTPHDYADYLEIDLEAARTASAAVSRIDFSPKELLEKGFETPELVRYQSQLAYQLNFPNRTLVYLSSDRIYLDAAEPFKVYLPL